VIPPSTIARPVQAFRPARAFPRRNAEASPTGKRLIMNGISCPSKNEVAVAISQ
jgi:hypothetical protein